MKAKNPIKLRVEVNSLPTALNTEQRKLYNTIVNQYNQEISLQGSPLQPLLLLNVNGVARTRKTFTLLKACTRIQEIAIVARKGKPVFRAAPTGIMAFNIIS